MRATASGGAPLLALAYRRAPAGRPVPSPLDAHFRHIAEHFACVLPGDPLAPDRLNVCLTFDDAGFDFQHRVLPLLERHGLRALLAVSPGLVPVRGAWPAANPAADPEAPCTWDELRTIARSGRVAIAAHGLSGNRLDRAGIDLDREIVYPGEFLSSMLGVAVESFVFPLGRCRRASLSAAHHSYRHVFGLGAATNAGWGAPLLNRVEADAMEAPDRLFAPRRLRAWRWRSWWNRLQFL